MFRQAVDRYRPLPAIWFLKQFMTYEELSDKVDRLATGFHKIGLKKGDVVAIALPNSFQYSHLLLRVHEAGTYSCRG